MTDDPSTKITDRDIEQAVATLRAGGVVGMPTETVYGLAADAGNAEAVARIFALKGRPSTNPLIVHVASVELAEQHAAIDERARRLFAAFSPGPLTIVLPLRGGVATAVTAGLPNVGIRIPRHPVARRLLEAFAGPVAAPSANLSNFVSPTTAAHVRDAFGDQTQVLDGGACDVGVESTVLSLAGPEPLLLRPGSVTREQIEHVLGEVRTFTGHTAADVPAASPGQHRKHYAPRSPAWTGEQPTLLALARPGAIVMVFGDVGSMAEPARPGVRVLRLPATPEGAMRSFYAALREADALRPSEIFIEMPPSGIAWDALRDRVRRATRSLNERHPDGG